VCFAGDGKYDNFVPGNSCFARTYGDALVGSVDREPFYGTDGVTKYVYETIEVGLPGSGSFDVGYFQYFGQNLTETKVTNRLAAPWHCLQSSESVLFHSPRNSSRF